MRSRRYLLTWFVTAARWPGQRIDERVLSRPVRSDPEYPPDSKDSAPANCEKPERSIAAPLRLRSRAPKRRGGTTADNSPTIVPGPTSVSIISPPSRS